MTPDCETDLVNILAFTASRWPANPLAEIRSMGNLGEARAVSSTATVGLGHPLKACTCPLKSCLPSGHAFTSGL